MEELLALIALLRIEGIGGQHIRKWRKAWGSLEVLWRPHGEKALPPQLREQLSNLSHLRREAEIIVQTCERLGIQTIPYYSSEFPPLLEEITAPPAILYKKGPHSLMGQPMVAVVGTRKPSAYGLKATEYFVESLIAAGVAIVSGLAYGIDAQAHRTALEKGGKTIAVLAHGLDWVYPPAHRRLAEELLKEGAWVSEYPPGTKLHPLYFPHRNRIIAGLAHMTLIVESRVGGGAFFTARAAFEANRPVFAVPGDIFSPTSEGTHVLIAEHVAQIAYHPEALLKELRLQTERLPLPTNDSGSPMPEDPLQAQIYTLLEKGSRHIDELCSLTGYSVSELNRILTHMEIEGWIRQKPGGFIFRETPPNAKS